MSEYKTYQMLECMQQDASSVHQGASSVHVRCMTNAWARHLQGKVWLPFEKIPTINIKLPKT